MRKLIYWEIKRLFNNKITYAIFLVLIIVSWIFANKYNSIYQDLKERRLSDINLNIDEIQGQLNYYTEISKIRGLEEAEQSTVDYYERMIASQTEKKEYIIKGDNKSLLKSEIDILKESTKEISVGSDISSKYGYDRDKVYLAKYEYMINNDIEYRYADNYYPSGLNLLLQISKSIYVYLLPIIYLLFSSISISSEFDNKTYKILFSHPIKKSKIVLSKFISCFIISAIAILISTISPLIIGSIINEFGDINYPVATFKNTSLLPVAETFIIKYTHINTILNVLIKITLFNFIIAILFNSLGVLISSLFKNKIIPLVITILGFISLYIFKDIIEINDLFNLAIYANSYEYVTGIRTLINPSSIIIIGILSMLVISIISIILSIFKINKMELNA